MAHPWPARLRCGGRFLISGKKFDLRLYALVTSYRPIMAYTCAPYTTSTPLPCTCRIRIAAVHARVFLPHVTTRSLMSNLLFSKMVTCDEIEFVADSRVDFSCWVGKSTIPDFHSESHGFLHGARIFDESLTNVTLTTKKHFMARSPPSGSAQEQAWIRTLLLREVQCGSQ